MVGQWSNDVLPAVVRTQYPTLYVPREGGKWANIKSLEVARAIVRSSHLKYLSLQEKRRCFVNKSYFVNKIYILNVITVCY